MYYQYYDDAPRGDKSFSIRLKGDSLICTLNEFNAGKRPDCNLKKDYMSEMYVIINLPISEKYVEINLYNTAFISMGKPQLYLHASSGTHKKDSIRIQVNDVLISLSHITEFLHQESLADTGEKAEISVCLNLDKDLPWLLFKMLFKKL